MNLPVTKSANPAANPVVALGVIGSAVSAGFTLSAGWPWYGTLALVVVIVAATIVTQFFTTPSKP